MSVKLSLVPKPVVQMKGVLGLKGERGDTGPQGDQGVQGVQGVQGLQGDTGPAGPANSLSIGTVTTGAAGSAASANITGTAPDQTLDLTIPRGDTGATGPANTLSIGTVTTLAAGASATASITGAAPSQTLNLGIPQGASGTSPTIANGSVINSVTATYTANADLTTAIPLDDTIPQNTEGTEVVTATITPSSATSKIRVRFSGQIAAAVGSARGVAALFVNSGTSAVRAASTTTVGANLETPLVLDFEHTPGSTAVQTYRIRVGGNATLRMNGTGAARLFGGVAAATLVLEEIKG